jgi:hypothetical protein
MKKIFYFVMTAALLCGCSDEETKTGNISGIVIDFAGEPIKAVSMTVVHTPENYNPDKVYSKHTMG